MRKVIERLNTKAALLQSAAHFHDEMTPQELIDDSIALLLDALDRMEIDAVKRAIDAMPADLIGTTRVGESALHDLGKHLDWMNENLTLGADGHRAVNVAIELFKALRFVEL